MAFISNKERNKLIKKTKKRYGWRKWVITFCLIVGLAYILVAAIAAFTGNEALRWFYDDASSTNYKDLTPYGQAMCSIGMCMVLWVLFSLFALWTMSSPVKIDKINKKLTSSALQGKKLDGTKNASQIAKERATKQ